MAAHGTFVWCDLSSYRPDVTKPFYKGLFGWTFSGGDYAIATAGANATAAIFEMPRKFQDMGMPSFWMSYIGVDDIDTAVETARAGGGKVELGPADFECGGRYALVRDPLGAGFTLYEGEALAGAGNRVGHALVVSDADAVMPFYADLFGWRFGEETDGTRPIMQAGRTIAHLHEIPDAAIRGKEQYWAVLFAASNAGVAKLHDLGGAVEADITLPEGPARVVRDPDRAAFFLLEAGSSTATQSTTPTPWRAWLGLALIALAFLTGWGWISTVFFAVWIAMGLRDRVTFLFETIEQERQPLLYWTVLAVFALLGIASLFYPGAAF